MDKIFLKIVPETFENESRDMRELNAVKKMDYNVYVIARQNEKKTLPYFYTNEIYSLVRFDYLKRNSNILLLKTFFLLKEIYSWKKKVIKYGVDINPKIISAHDLFSLWIGYGLKKIIERESKNACKLVYDSHELTTERAGLKQSRWLYRQIVEHYERMYIHKADAIMVVSDSIAEYNKKKYKLRRTPYVIRNIPVIKKNNVKYDHFRKIFGIDKNKIILLYQGAFIRGRGIKNILDALKQLDKKFVFVMLGYTENEFKNVYSRYAEEFGIKDRVYYLPSVPNELLNEYSNSADIGICLIENFCLSYYYCLPNKLFEYINADLPVLCSDFPEMSKIVQKYGVGEAVEYNNIVLIVETINNMTKSLEKYKKNINEAHKELNWDKEEKKLLDMYSNLEKKV